MVLNEGIVIKSTKYLENSKIIYILSENGLNSYLVKGGMKLSYKGRSYTQDISLIKYDFSSGKGFDILTSGQLVTSYINIKEDLSRLTYVYLIFELIIEFNEHVNDKKLFYDFTLFTLDKINSSSFYKYYYLVYALKILYLLGVGPDFNRCVKCGSDKNIVGFDFSSPGMICANCFNGDSLIYSSEVVKYCKVLYYTKLNNFTDEFLSKLFNDNDQFDSIKLFVDRYYNRYLGFKSKTGNVLNTLK